MTESYEIIFESYEDRPELLRDLPGFATRAVMAVAQPRHWKELCESVRSLYWTTNITAREIRDAYLPGRSVNTVPAIAGPIKITRDCDDCGTPLFITSRKAFPYSRCPDCWGKWHRQTLADLDAAEAAERATLAALQRMPYREYLQSGHWKRCRSDALRRAGYACQTCSAKGELHVHHRTYARRGHEADTDLIVLCAGCHEIFHANGKLADGGRA